MMILNKKTIDKLGSQMNNNLGSKPSSFALKQMEKMGWKEGMGLGKNESGMSKHIVIEKREEKSGIGSEKIDIEETNENWWHDAFSSNLRTFKVKIEKSKKEKKSKKDKKDKKSKKEKRDKKRKRDGTENENETTVETISYEYEEISKSKTFSEPPSYEELFRATGGARLGMRARMRQTGKIKRTENI